MIQPFVDFTGSMSKAQVDAINRQAMIDELRRQADGFQVLESMQIVASDNVTYNASNPVTSNVNFATIPHNLGYIPVFMVFFALVIDVFGNLAYSPLPYFSAGVDAGASPGSPAYNKVAFRIWAHADTANLYIDMRLGYATAVSLPAGQPGFMFKYYIFSQPNS